MSEPAGRREPAPHPPAGGRAIFLARLALAWERVWPAAWPVLAVLGLWAVFALLGLPDRIPALLHAALLLLFAFALGWALWRLLRRLGLPGIALARRRLERDSGLAHRPLTTLDDHLAVGSGDPFAEALWSAHRARLRATLEQIRVRLPRPGLPAHDPRAVRLLLLLVLVLAVLGAGGDVAGRLGRALLPNFAPLASRAPAVAQLWVTPPAYTNLPPLYLHAEESAATADQTAAAPAKPVMVPVGSRILARLQGGRGTPELVLGGKRVAFTPVDATTFQLEDALIPGDRIAVEQNGRIIGQWPVTMVPDLPPKIAFASPPVGTLRGALRIEYTASDDYGVASAKAVIRRAGVEAPLIVDLPLPSGHPREAHETSFHDLTAHPWAGLPVTLRLAATDEPGQRGESETVELVLPERNFTHPAARAIAEARKSLLREPAARQPVVAALEAIASSPSRFGDDTAVFLSLVTAAARLTFDPSADAVTPVQQQLWDTALAVEEGHLPTAERELRALQEKLRDALANNASEREIENLMTQLQAAIDRYLQALAKPQNGEARQDQDQQQDEDAKSLSAEDLHRLVDRAREMARTGARDAAKQMLSRLQDMLENMRNARTDQSGKGKGTAAQMMRGIDDLIKRQNKLLEHSFRSTMQSSGGEQQEPDPSSLPNTADEQDSTRRALGELMRRLGEMSGDIPQALGQAEQAMRGATEALRRGSAAEAVDPQSQALERLRAGRQSMRDGLRRQLGQEGDDESLDAFGPGRDPTGRIMPGLGKFDGNDVRIPEHGEVQRAREIQDELQRRAGQRQRPEIELEYIDRLLKRF